MWEMCFKPLAINDNGVYPSGHKYDIIIGAKEKSIVLEIIKF